jgi:D-Tyr-tRNAtyr deacylase
MPLVGVEAARSIKSVMGRVGKIEIVAVFQENVDEMAQQKRVKVYEKQIIHLWNFNETGNSKRGYRPRDKGCSRLFKWVQKI